MEGCELKKARARALKLLGYRSRSRFEIERYLERRGFDANTISSVIDEMSQVGYIDDVRFTDEYMAYCVRRGYGPRRAWSRLREKGIARQTIESRLGLYFDPESDMSRARAILDKRARAGEDRTDRRWIGRQAAFLKSRGFHDSIILKILGDTGEFEEP